MKANSEEHAISAASSGKMNACVAFVVRWRVTLVVAFLSVTTAFTACYVTWHNQVLEYRRQYQDRVDGIADTIGTRLRHYEIAMEMARGLFVASEDVTAEEWRVFTTSDRFVDQIPGVYGFAYVERIPADQIDTYVAVMRANDDPDFNVFDTDLYDPAPYDDYCVIRYNEPRGRNASTIGLNVASIPVSADAMWRSVLYDRMAVSHSLSLQQTGASTIGIVLYLPIFAIDSDTSTPETRMRSVSQWVAMPITMHDFLADIWASDWHDINGMLVEQSEQDGEVVLFSSLAKGQTADWVREAPSGAGYQTVIPIDEWQWVLRARDTSPWVPIFSVPVIRVGVMGGVISILLVMLSWSLTRTGDRAKQLAKQLTRSLRRSEQRYALAVHGSNGGLWDWDLTTGKMYYAPRWKELLGLSEEEVGDHPEEWFSRIAPGCLGLFHAGLAEHIAGDTERFNTELEMRYADGTPRWMLCRAAAVRDEDGKALRIAGSLADITDLKNAQDELRALAHQDQLTGLANRALFSDRLGEAITRAKGNPGYRYAVLFLDFDRFKVINDSLGHSMGDRLLTGMAERILASVREVDTVARFGGDEFVILMDGVRGDSDALDLSLRLQETLSKPFDFDSCEVISTVSIGVVLESSDYQIADEVIRDADAAMYQAKAGGRARYCLFDSQMHIQAVRRMKLEQDLRKRDFDEQFRTYYQPLIDLESGEISGFEALLRWEHPEHGQIQPGEFIAIAEESALIVELGEWVMLEACKQMAQWRLRFDDAAKMSINVNLSRRQLLHADLIKSICDVLDQTGLPASALKLEVTESTVMDNPHSVVTVMERIRELGVRLSMDDFGTGHSSLSCLHQFPIDQLKIDRGFIVNMEEHREFAAVMDAIVTLAHFLHLEVVAEGIENADQLAQLQAMDCTIGQGFYFAEPMPAGAATEYLAGFRDNATEAA